MAGKTTHDKFIEYLQKTLRKPLGKSIELAVFAETELPGFIRRHFRPDFGELYDNTDHRFYDKVIGEIFGNQAATNEDALHNDAFTEALSLYAKFLDSKAFKGREKVRLTEHEKALKKAKVKKPSGQCADGPQSAKPRPDPLQPFDDEREGQTEGRIRQVTVTRHERNPALRQLCLQKYGYVCQVCGMDFEERYGEIGRCFIEVHHLNPIANTDGEHALDPENGLVPLCSNCHSMIHRGGTDGQPMGLDKLKEIYRQHQKNK